MELAARLQPFADGRGLGAAVERLRRRLYRRSSDRVLCDLLEDDLAQARDALEDIAGWLDGLVETLGEGPLSPEGLAARAGCGDPIEDVDRLAATLSSLRRRLGTVADRARLSAGSPIRRP